LGCGSKPHLGQAADGFSPSGFDPQKSRRRPQTFSGRAYGSWAESFRSCPRSHRSAADGAKIFLPSFFRAQVCSSRAWRFDQKPAHVRSNSPQDVQAPSSPPGNRIGFVVVASAALNIPPPSGYHPPPAEIGCFRFRSSIYRRSRASPTSASDPHREETVNIYLARSRARPSRIGGREP